MTDQLDRLKAALADRYKLEHQLGVGGMATVYLAEDLKHHRKVAVKVLRPELAAVLGAERFVQEITTTASLQHPNILPLFDSGEADGFLYYVMPYIEGESLRDKLNRETQLGIEEAVKITTEVADALDSAHRHNVIHRDIKPENILLHDGRPMVADFGIALAVSAMDGTRLTETGLSLGTPAYMSPEQVSGDRELDGRSDLYSLACVTYEMLAGDPPFVASTAQALMARHVTDAAPPIRTVRPGVSPAVAAAIAKGLSKAPADRFASSAAFVKALSAPAHETAASTNSIVVLPFANISSDSENQYFSDGLTEEIITDLATIETLRVISRTSAMSLKGTNKDLKTIGRELNVRYVLEGSVRKARDSLRITAQLIDATNDTHVWAEKYSGTLDNVFDIQEQVSRAIAKALRLRLSAREEKQIAKRPTGNVHAYECYLRARHLYGQFAREPILQAVRHLQNGLSTIGDDPLLYFGLGSAYFNYGSAVIGAHAEYLEKAETCARRVLDLEPNTARGEALLGMIMFDRFQTVEGLRYMKRALTHDPNNPDALWWFAIACAVCGKVSAATTGMLRLLDVDPLNAWNYWIAGFGQFVDGQSERAIINLQKAHDMQPENSVYRTALGMMLAHAQRVDEAVSLLDVEYAQPPTDEWAVLGVVLKHALRGDGAGVELAVTKELAGDARTDMLYSWFLADCYSFIDERERALDWLDNAVVGGFINYPFLARFDTLLESVHTEKRFVSLMKNVKRRWEALVI